MRSARVIVLVLAAALTAACGLVSSATSETDKTITLVASDSGFQPEVIALLKEEIKKHGYELKHMVINDIVQPNQLVEDKQADANFFQHEAYMTQFNADHNLHIVPAFYTTFAPSGFFSRKYRSFGELPDGARIGIPADPANNGRALFILRDAGLLKMTAGVPVTKASTRDVLENPKRLKFVEVDQLMLQRTLDDVDAGFLFSSTAIVAGLDVTKDSLGLESAENSPYRGIIGTRPELKGGPKMEALRRAFQSDRIKDLYTSKYGKAVVFLW
jgi:D-methionine transport system substrate-binding protein